MSDEQNWNNYFINLTETISTRATCHRKHVGAIIVKNNRILATGYNGSISGSIHCNDDNHLMERGHCVRTIHAEMNAIIQCARYGIACDGATIYINTFPCWNCFKTIVNAGIKNIYYKDDYNSEFAKHVINHSIELRVIIRKL